MVTQHLMVMLLAQGFWLLMVILQFGGTFDFRGIIIAYKEASIKTELNGTGRVIGSLIVSGNSVDMSISNGTFNALYSKETLNNAKINLKSSRFQILSWWE